MEAAFFCEKSVYLRLRGNAVHKSRGLVNCTFHQIPYGEDDTVGECVIHENSYGLGCGDVQSNRPLEI
jgi:hypothetical protein